MKAKTKKASATLTLSVAVITDLALSLRFPCLSFAVHVATGAVLVAFGIACPSQLKLIFQFSNSTHVGPGSISAFLLP